MSAEQQNQLPGPEDPFVGDPKSVEEENVKRLLALKYATDGLTQEEIDAIIREFGVASDEGGHDS